MRRGDLPKQTLAELLMWSGERDRRLCFFMGFLSTGISGEARLGYYPPSVVALLWTSWEWVHRNGRETGSFSSSADRYGRCFS